MFTAHRTHLFRLISVLSVIAMLATVITPAAAVTVGNDTIDFIGVRYNYPNPGESTWYYKVVSGTQPAISHVDWQLNLDCLSAIGYGTWDGVNQDSLNPGGGNPVIGTDPTTGITGIKFDQGFNDGETRYYYFTVDGNYSVDTTVVVASKGGPSFDTANIEGPSLSCAEDAPGLSIVKQVNGADANTDADALAVTEGDALTFTYDVTNTGNVTLTNISVTDNVLGTVCTIASLAPGASTSCTKPSTAALGLHGNTGTASAVYISTQVTAADDAYYNAAPAFVPAPSITIVKTVNAEDANTPPGLAVIEGDALTFEYVVTNNGNVALTNLTVSDDVLGSICSVASLSTGDSFSCLIGAPPAVLGTHTNIGTVTGEYNASPVTDSDPATYTASPRFVPAPLIDLVKYVNGHDANAGSPIAVLLPNTVTFTFVVTNVGNVPLTDVTVDDDIYGAITCPQTALAVGESMTCTLVTDALSGVNTDTGVGTGWYNGSSTSDSDTAQYVGKSSIIAKPGVRIHKYVNGKDANDAPGISVPVGSTVTFTYIVKNVGNVTLNNIVVTDPRFAPPNNVICRISTLAPMTAVTCTRTAIAIPGGYTNTGKVSAWYGSPQYGGINVTDYDYANYTGY